MSNLGKKKLKVMIIEDDEDLLCLYRDYLLSQGHDIVSCCLSANNIMVDFEKFRPDVCLMDYRISGRTNGIDAAMEILAKYPSAPIIFLTAYGPLNEELVKFPKLRQKNVQVIFKPVRLSDMENAMVKLVEENE
ncbi:hypothetical protein BH18THE1_BH18THE1_10070 [soil metagenome]